MTMQNVIVLGGSYAGSRAAHLLGQGLPSDKFRVIMIDRNSHANHLYVFPRFAVLPGHEHKAFIPYTRIFGPPPPPPPSTATTNTNTTNQSSSSFDDVPPAPPPAPAHVVLHAKVVHFSPDAVIIDRTFPELGFHSRVIPYRYAVYALGNRLPAPIDVWAPEEEESAAEIRSRFRLREAEAEEVGEEADIEDEEVKTPTEYGGTKKEAMDWLRRCQDRIRAAESILCVGGGALGIQFATDIKSLYPEKQVTLLHSRHRLLPRFEYDLHCEVLKTVEDLRIDLILGERLDLASTRPEHAKVNERGQRVVRTEKGREVAADLLLLCTGQIPNTDLLAEMSPQSVDPTTKLAYVLPTMQLGIIPPPPAAGEHEHEESSLPSELDLRQLRIHEHEESSLASASSGTLIGDNSVEEEEGELEQLPETPFPHIFVAGDCADAFGAIKAGHTAYWQAEVAARNILRLARREVEAEAEAEAAVAVAVATKSEAGANTEVGREAQAEVEAGEGEVKEKTERNKEPEPESLELESYTPGPPAIKVSLGIGRTAAYQFNGMVGRKDTPESDDLDAPLVWGFFGMGDATAEEMFD